MKLPILFFSVVVFIPIAAATRSTGDSDGTLKTVASAGHARLTAAAYDCCRESSVTCCGTSIHYHLPVHSTCLHDLGKAERESTIQCLEQSLHSGRDLLRLNSTVSPCCKVFTPNQWDTFGICERTCTAALTTVGLNSHAKLARIKACLHANPLFDCFEECVDNRRIGVMAFPAYCRPTERVTDGSQLAVEEQFMKSIS